jgi:hypothetical protein
MHTAPTLNHTRLGIVDLGILHGICVYLRHLRFQIPRGTQFERFRADLTHPPAAPILAFMFYIALAQFVVLGYFGSLASRMMTRQSGRMLGAVLFLVPLIGFIIVLEQRNGWSTLAIWGCTAAIACPIGAGMGLCACRRRRE